MNSEKYKKKMIKVLIAEDDTVPLKLLERNIKKWGYKVIIAKDGEQAWKAFRDEDIQLAILDWMMPKIEGVELCRKVRQEKKAKYIYIILLTSKDNQDDIIKGLSAGADDYIVKPFNSLELRARLQTGKRIIELENKLVELATRDSLTKLWNRASILELLEEEFSRSKRNKQSMGTIMLDIDGFKNINDTYGHPTGDAVLSEVASRLKKKVRDYDQIGRYGGDELLLVLPKCGREEIKKVAERLNLVVCDKKVKTKKGLLDITISLGGSFLDNQNHISAKNLIAASDKALYQAKNKGRNCAVIDKYQE